MTSESQRGMVDGGSLALPSYEERYQLHRIQTGGRAGHCTAFSDAAGIRRIQGWTEPTTLGLTLYREAHPDRLFSPDVGAWANPQNVVAPAPVDGEAVEGMRAAAAMMWRILGRVGIDQEPTAGGQGIIECIQASTEPALVRRLWRLSGQVHVLDPACGDGAWLSGCLQLLGAVGVACLERMQGWVGDTPESRAHRRALADFRRLLARWEEIGREGCRDRLAYERILSGCLHGLDANPANVAQCRRRLAAMLGGLELPMAADDSAFADIREGRLPERLATSLIRAEASAGSEQAVPSTVACLRAREEALLLDRAAGQLGRLRLTLGGSVAEAAAGWREIARRRAVLRRLIRHQDSSAPGDWIAPWLEYPGVVARGGFDLVRGMETIRTMGNGHADRR